VTADGIGMSSVRLVPNHQVAPGDVGFDRGRSTYGRIVEKATRTPVAHCFVYHRRLGTTPDGTPRWLIAEMSARRGAVFTERIEEPLAAVRVWRLPSEQARLLAASRELVRMGADYDWREVGRILATLVTRRSGADREPVADRAICVAHVHRAVLAARPDLQHALPPLGRPLWPGRLLEALTGLDVTIEGTTILQATRRALGATPLAA
jgi:hypothetical protein